MSKIKTTHIIGMLSGILVVLVLLLPTLPGPTASADDRWTPIVAKRRIIKSEIHADGREVILHEGNGDYLRSAEGKLLVTEAPVVDGVSQESVRFGTLQDFATGTQHRILYGQERVFRTQTPTRRKTEVTQELLQRIEQKGLRKEIVNGVLCYGFPVVFGLPDGSSATSDSGMSGMGWRSLDHDFTVKFETERNDGTTSSRTVEEIYEIRLGVEPPPERLTVPADFVEQASTSDQPPTPFCSSCQTR